MLSAACLLTTNGVFAQTPKTNVLGQYNTITTGVPFLRISPDATAGAMGDVGIATDPEANAQFWNVAKLSMASKNEGASMTYTPWLKDLVGDIALYYLTAYKKFGENNNQAVSGSLRYFNLGDINYIDVNQVANGTGKPREYALDAGYSRKLSDKLSLGVTGRYIHSNLATGSAATTGYKAGNAFAVDAGIYYTKNFASKNDDISGNKFNFGAVISNLGTKISYSDTRKDFLPTNLGVGAAYIYKIDEFNTFTVALDLNKLLVPSPQFDSLGNQYYPTNESVINGLFKSFGDAPGGGKEELQEINGSLGVEYGYQNQFFARAGYFYEDKYKGDRKYATVGLGFKYTSFGLNFSYLVPSGSGLTRNPLSNTLRFSLTFDFDKIAAKKKQAADANTEE